MGPLDNLNIWNRASAVDRSVLANRSENVWNYYGHFSTYETLAINKLS